MLVGAMNHPRKDVEAEIRWMAEMGLDFIDLTLEPPAAGYWQIDRKKTAAVLAEHGLGVVGHTAYYLPLGHPFEEVRRGAVAALASCVECFAELGARKMNIHPDSRAPMHNREFSVRQNLRSLRELEETSRRLGVDLMIENLPGEFSTVEELAPLLEPMPGLGLHLDIGHTNLQKEGNTTEGILAAYAERVRHVHLHDNRAGGADLHLPLGAGDLDLKRCVRALKRHGYDGTITLEVFSPDPFFLRYSRDVLRRAWDEADD